MESQPRAVFVGIVASIVLATAMPACVCADAPAAPLMVHPDIVRVIGIPDPSVQAAAEAMLLTRPGAPLNEGWFATDCRVLSRLLADNGWWNARVTAASATLPNGRTTLDFTAEPGPRILLGRVTVTGGDAGDGAAMLNESYGQPFTRGLVEHAAAVLVGEYAARGYPAVTVTPSLTLTPSHTAERPQTTEAHGDTVALTFRIEPGARAVVDSIAVRGLVTTDERIVRRELAGLTGRYPDDPLLREVVARLARLRFVRATGDPSIEYDGRGRCIVVVPLAEGEQGSFDGALGYQPAGVDGKSGFVGMVDLAFASLFGTGREAAVRWEDRGAGFEDLALSYREPWVLSRPFDLTGSFLHEEREARGYTRTVLTAGVARTIGALRLSAAYRHEKTSADTLLSAAASGAEFTLSYTALDDPADPRGGFRYGVGYTVLSKRPRFGGDAARLERTALDLDHYLPVRRRESLAILLRYRNVDAPLDRLGQADRFWLGGTESIRGYPEAFFPAVKAGWGSVEYRVHTGGSRDQNGDGGRVFLFVDGGWLLDRRPGEHAAARTLVGYGFGLRIASEAGTLGFDYGLGRGDGIGEGKLHVRLRRGF